MTINYITKDSQKFDKKSILELVKSLDVYFVPPLSERIDLIEYVNKIDQYANIVLAYTKKRKLIGIITFYNNDIVSKTAFISILGVMSKYQGQGVASNLVNMCIKECRLAGMNKIIVKTEAENFKAIRFYNTFGFKVKERLNEHNTVKVKMYLKLLKQ